MKVENTLVRQGYVRDGGRCDDVIGLLTCWRWGFEHEQCHWVYANQSLISVFFY
jgi:hypothetical protein